jgi:starch synthase
MVPVERRGTVGSRKPQRKRLFPKGGKHGQRCGNELFPYDSIVAKRFGAAINANMKILMVGTEMAPLARTGGLGDVLNALPAELQRRGHEVSVVLPLYRGIRENPAISLQSTGVEVSVHVGSKRMDAGIYECIAPNGVQVFFVRRDEYFDRSGIYGADPGRSYDDNAERFIYFSRAAVELACHITPAPDVLHAHDWQAALVPVFSKERGLPFGTVLTIHNLAYQGSFWGVDFGLTNLPAHYFSEQGLEFHGQVNFLKGGILSADAVTTVSERYARDIQTAEDGCGLDGVLRAQAFKLTGILNGADYTVWNPSTDDSIAARYSVESLGGKRACRDALLAELGLEPDPRGPVFAMVGRLAEQKGIDLLIPVLDRLLADDVRLVVLGEGESRFERELLVISRRYPGKFVFKQRYDVALAHRINAGADAVLIPSHFEPCGLSAMHALAYGAIPIVRACGGLYQIVQDDDPSSGGGGNGFVFYEESAAAFWDALGRAKKVFADRKAWAALMTRAMRADFSWPAAAAQYEQVYERVAGRHALRPEITR